MKGFTLLEIMVALAIMAGVLFTIIGATNYHLSIVNRDRAETDALLLARLKLEEWTLQKSSENKGTFAPQWPDYAWEKTVEETTFPGIAKTTLTVRWETGRKSLALVNYGAK